MKFFFQILIFLFPAILFAEAPPVVMEKGKEFYEVGLNLDVLIDDTQKLTIEDVASRKYQSKFKPSDKKVPNFGFSKGKSFWFKINIKKPEHMKKKWFLVQNYKLQDRISFFKRVDGKWIPYHTGDELKFSDRPNTSGLPLRVA